jgi:murein DD-endopeptidase MepM/ murein hydrolase activator NlpD
MAVTSGQVTSADYEGAYGNAIVIGSGKDFEILYGHMSGFAVASGDVVSAGQVIGYVGNTGNVIGANGGYHVHVETRLNGVAVDPMPILRAHGLDP